MARFPEVFFIETTITVKILSEYPIDGEMSLKDIEREMDEGDFVGITKVASVKTLTRKQVNKRLKQFGSSPDFFGESD